MHCAGSKSNCGNQDGYFQKPFKRVFEGEGKGREEDYEAHPADNKPAFYAGGYGTHDDKIEAMGTAKKEVDSVPQHERNFYSGPVKEGDAGFDKNPKHSNDQYEEKSNSPVYGENLHGPMHTAHYTSDYFQKNPFLDSEQNYSINSTKPMDK